MVTSKVSRPYRRTLQILQFRRATGRSSRDGNARLVRQANKQTTILRGEGARGTLFCSNPLHSLPTRGRFHLRRNESSAVRSGKPGLRPVLTTKRIKFSRLDCFILTGKTKRSSKGMKKVSRYIVADARRRSRVRANNGRMTD